MNKTKVILPQKGTGRKHKDATIPYLVKSNISEKNGYTILEVELKVGHNPGDLKIGSGTFNMIVAYGSKDNLKSYHQFRTPITVNLE